MKILQVIPFFSPKYGGTVNSTYILSKELSKAGHEVTILTTDIDHDDGYVNSIEREGVNVVQFPFIFNVGLLIYSPAMKKWLDNNLEDFDVIHMHNFRSYQNSIVRKYAIKYNIPYILQARGSLLPFFQKQTLKKLYDFVWGNKILENATAVVALTKMEAKQYSYMGVVDNKIKIIPNPIDFHVVSENLEEGRFRLKYGINEDDKIILYLGRLNSIKGIDLLVESFSNLLNEKNNVKLIIVGPDDGFKNYLESLVKELQIENEVSFTGPLYGNDKFEAYLDADVYVLPSRYEIFGNTILEAAACGTPIIVTENCGISDFVEEFGYVVPYEVKKLEKAIKRVLNNELSVKTCKEQQKLLEKRFSLEKFLNSVERLYGKLH